ncbi:MAG: Holliday junction resolvase RuvX [Weeksellaceae bacterium]|jgi:putative Holliday junction resolvase|nr:Holliday junction resolvase RuvX [Weeksellaceae bacterium]MDX9704238.1 Holliday junction resolvase RuvX [Weeksellaceae bacterium]
MPRIIALDYGTKRTGIAVTDELQIIATALETVETANLMKFLTTYIAENPVQEIVVGLPMRMHGEVGQLETEIQKFIQKFTQKHPSLPIFRQNETFTSKMAAQTLFETGLSKKKRKDKTLVDKVSATIILQSYMETKQNLKI